MLRSRAELAEPLRAQWGVRCKGREARPKSPIPSPSNTQAIDEDGSGFISESELTEALMQASGLVDGVSRSEVSQYIVSMTRW